MNKTTYEELKARCTELAAENAGLKAALRPSDIPSEWTDAFGDTAVIEHDSTGDNQGHSVSWSWVGNQEEVIKSVLLAVDGSIKTPATDAFLAEVRAGAIPDDVMAAIQKVARIRLDLNDFDGDKRGIIDCLGEAEESLIEAVNKFAAQLLKGVQS